MTGMQEHPATGRTLDHQPTGRVVIEDLARSLGIEKVHVTDPTADPAAFQDLVAASLRSEKLELIVARRNCLLAAGKIKEYARAAAQNETCKPDAT
jgi:indolepyruvate ferredoxin oxidoreductase alpha subunit